MNCPNTSLHDLLAELLKTAELSIFDFSDDFVELVYDKETLELYKDNVTKYAKEANIVITVNEHIKSKYSYLNSNIHVIRNATNYFNFDRKNYNRVDRLEKIKDINQPIIGYSGIANLSRIDSELLDFIICKKPDWQFVFVGHAKPNFLKKYSDYNNVHHLLPVDYQILPDYLRYFDVAIVPFAINKNTMGNDLLKFHDYLAMGKPIVSTEIGGAEDFKDVIRIARNSSDFLEAIEKALDSDTPQDISKRKNVALANSWHNRVKELESLLCNKLGLYNYIK